MIPHVSNCYWQIGDDQTQFWSSRAQAFVSPDDPAFVAWQARGYLISTVDNESDLSRYLAKVGMRGPVVLPEQVVAERERRLALGFDYTFQDERGVHRIGTTEQDRKGWDEVTDMANAAINSGQPQTQIVVVTDTGPATITAMEWQAILLAAAQVRQNIWAKSFALQAQDPIPLDFATNEEHWTA